MTNKQQHEYDHCIIDSSDAEVAFLFVLFLRVSLVEFGLFPFREAGLEGWAEEDGVCVQILVDWNN